MASTRAITSACSGCCSAAKLNSEWIAASLASRLRALLPALVFEVVQERGDQRRVEILDPQAGGRSAGALLSEGQEKPQRVAVGRNGVRAGVLLPGEPVGEERLQGRGERGHGITAGRGSSRSAASASSSGAADRYQ